MLINMFAVATEVEGHFDKAVVRFEIQFVEASKRIARELVE